MEESLALSALSDHPRSRGVYQHPLPPASSHPGSSPLARGLRRLDRDGHYKERIIPARAGFTRAAVSGSWGRSDHPRSRGVYAGMGCRGGSGAGSSPLARGLRVGSACASRRRRIIPARAGFTTLGTRNPWHRGDHPRSRGVYPTKSGEFAQDQGSSPLARGLRPCVASRSAWSRIIPARAGFTGVQGPASARRRDHPRSRGVYSSCPPPSSLRQGSSPLARGLRDVRQAPGGRLGIIPARAGFTLADPWNPNDE